MRPFWFQLHRWLGLSAGLVLMLMGATGATLAFQDEILRARNPGLLSVTPDGRPPLALPALLEAARAAAPQARIVALSQFSDGRAARAMLAGAEGARRGDTLYLDPRDGHRLGLEADVKGQKFFRAVEDLHRRLVLDDVGRRITGSCALLLALLAAVGLYLRAHQSLRRWWIPDLRVSGRRLLWNLHAAGGTWLLPLFLVSGFSGAVMGFPDLRDALYRAAQLPPPAAGGRGGTRGEGAPREAAPLPDLVPAWETFRREVPDWRSVMLRLPERAGAPLAFQYLGADAPHSRAFSRIEIAADGAVKKHERFLEKSGAAQALASVFALHSGEWLGTPGRALMMLSALSLPAFAVTGWTLFLTRRRATAASS